MPCWDRGWGRWNVAVLPAQVLPASRAGSWEQRAPGRQHCRCSGHTQTFTIQPLPKVLSSSFLASHCLSVPGCLSSHMGWGRGP